MTNATERYEFMTLRQLASSTSQLVQDLTGRVERLEANQAALIAIFEKEGLNALLAKLKGSAA